MNKLTMITVFLTGVLVGLNLLSGVAGSDRPAKQAGHAIGQADQSFKIDHTAVDAAEIPLAWLDAARQIDTFFAHRSLGNNIIDGLLDLQAVDPERYAIAFGTSGPDWFDTYNGIGHTPLGSNGYPQTKIDGFDDFIRGGYSRANVAMMKFCPGDSIPFGTMAAATIWAEYRDMMVELERDYPDVMFIWWTFPLATASDNRGNDEKAIFNAAVRNYCAANGCRLFDIADIQSHDPNGAPVVSATGHEAMWDGYSDDGGHFNAVGRARAAEAFWWLLARAAGWQDEDDWIALQIEPTVVTLGPGETTQVEVTVTAGDAVIEPVMLAAESVLPGLTISFAPNPVVSPGTANATLLTDSATPAGEYDVTLSARAGQTSAIAVLRLVVEPATAFTLRVDPVERVIFPGQPAVYRIESTGSPGFDAPIALTAVGLPPGVTASWQGNPLLPEGYATLILSGTDVAPYGRTTFSVQGTAGDDVASAEAVLLVYAGGFLPFLVR